MFVGRVAGLRGDELRSAWQQLALVRRFGCAVRWAIRGRAVRWMWSAGDMSLATLIEMFGPTAKPVEHYKAEGRGAICEICPKNTAALWWEKMFKDPIANTI